MNEVSEVVDRHGEFLRRTLIRIGVPDGDLDDVFQEVLVVVLRQLRHFEGRAKMTTWLASVCIRVASTYRRRAWLRRELPTPEIPDQIDARALPDEELSTIEEMGILRETLRAMDPEKRRILVMFAIDELSCEEIAARLDIPAGTVHSRLHRARRDFLASAAHSWTRRRGSMRSKRFP